MANTWSDREIDAIVKDYFVMLEYEQTGRTFIKAEHWRELVEAIGRSKGSIEHKHMNISAVMDALGLPYIDGYKPYKNYQKALFAAVEAYLGKRHDLYELLTGEAESLLYGTMESKDNVSIVFDKEPPPLGTPKKEVPEDIRHIIKRFEPPAERDGRNRKLGKAGESFVFESEKHRLQAIGRGDLSDRVRWVARDDGDGYGYDILSFSGKEDEANRELWLEVKTTNGPRTTPFYITNNELRVSEQRPDKFRIIRLYSFRRQVRGYRLIPPLEQHVKLSPTIYRASF